MVHLLVHHKWFIRAILAIFWAAEIIAYAFNVGFITYLLEHHTWWSLIILFLTFKYLIEPFYGPFCTLKTRGGDAIMEKSTKIMLVLVAALASVLTVMFVSPGARETIITTVNNTIFKPAMGVWLRFVNWLDAVRGIYILGSGLVGGLVLAIFLNQIALPKIRHKQAVISAGALNVQREPAEPEYAPMEKSTPSEKTEKPLVETETVAE